MVIVGSGVAGLSAAVYAARADLEPRVLEGVGGMELIQRGKDQAERFGAEFVRGTVEDATLTGRPLELELSIGDSLRTRALIVATGARAGSARRTRPN